MRSLRPVILAAALLVVAAPGATALQWNPQSTVTGPFSGVKTLSVGGISVSCTIGGNIVASGAIAVTTDATGRNAPPTWSACSSTIAGSSCATSSSPWTFTATSTTTVTESPVNFVMKVGGCTTPLCTITVSGASIAGNGWSNTTHAITESPTARVTVSVSGSILCPRATSGTLTGTIAFPATVTIT